MTTHLATTTYRVNRPLLTLARRVRRSELVADVRHGLRNVVLPGLGVLLVLYVAVLVLRGLTLVAYAYGVVR